MNKTARHFLKEAIGYYEAGQYQEALSDCESAIKLDPSFARAYHGRGLIRSKQQRYKEALEDYQKACELNLVDAKFFADIGEIYFILLDYEKASEYFRKALQLNSRYESVYQQKTQELLDRAFEEREPWTRLLTITAFERVLQFNPDNIEAGHQISKIKQVREKIEQVMRKPSLILHNPDCKCASCVNYE